MRPSFHPRLIHAPLSDPGLFVHFEFQKFALLFDAGDLSPLSARDLLKVSHLFISHAHMDHVIGFDYLVRLNLGRQKHLRVYGPEGILGHIRNRLSGYAWNLVDSYTADFRITVHEITEVRCLSQELACRDGFAPNRAPRQTAAHRTLAAQPAFTVTCDILDHGMPCLGFRLEEPFHVNVIPEALGEMGLSVGPWVSRLKQLVMNQAPDSTAVEATDARGHQRRVRLGQIKNAAVRITEGQVIAYITDVAGHDRNIRRIRHLAAGADELFIEAMFLEEDRDRAQAKHHLTAARAGTIAAVSGARRYRLFHFSPRYTDREQELHDEARRAYLRAGGNSSPPGTPGVR